AGRVVGMGGRCRPRGHPATVPTKCLVGPVLVETTGAPRTPVVDSPRYRRGRARPNAAAKTSSTAPAVTPARPDPVPPHLAVSTAPTPASAIKRTPSTR